ncbi:NPR1/NH1-interacting protein [Dillenia turbinata]|uniref:NPR1/NH1-interacting protein n=1 Tax=Dillenia turbinata TaxID=194707 RepID=A0AAN8W4E0_9MAGN
MEREKREKNDCETTEQDDREEEEKMETFYAIIRSFQEARNRRKIELREMEEEERKKRRKRLKESETQTWVPSFKLEDFAEEIEFRRPPLVSSGTLCHSKKGNEKEEHITFAFGLLEWKLQKWEEKKLKRKNAAMKDDILVIFESMKLYNMPYNSRNHLYRECFT